MKVLILTTATGQGHNEAAEALRKKYIANKHEVKVLDFIPSTSKLAKALIIDGYELLATKHPLLYGKLYKITNNKVTSISVDLLLRTVEKCVYETIVNERPDVIVGTHPFAVQIIGLIKKRRTVAVPFISVVTDFKPHYTYIDSRVNAYVTASEYTKEALCMNNISEQKVFTYGIPIKEEFYYKGEKNKNDKFTILLMGGSMGLMIIEKVLENLLKAPNNIKVIVVCGRNNLLYNNLSRKYENAISKSIVEIKGFTREVSKIMENSDVIITKPGGLTVCEAIAKRLPMVIPFAIPGQEAENLDFLVNNGAAIRVENIEHINEVINSLIDNPNKIMEMKKSMKKLGENYSSENIVKLSQKLVQEFFIEMAN